jgi:hypothetical protein
MIFGYARVSTDAQDLTAQLRDLKAAIEWGGSREPPFFCPAPLQKPGPGRQVRPARYPTIAERSSRPPSPRFWRLLATHLVTDTELPVPAPPDKGYAGSSAAYRV